MVEGLFFNNRVRMWRAETRMSQNELADTVGVSRQTISSIENLQFVPSARLALLICLALNKTFEDVFFFDKKPAQPGKA
ncbi:helix-turn-helix transcriptional regulator [Ruminococcaceae bacterium OttesenSCG-928-D13]|nr:helix-turn-helix transcriptional regulator [Ruminococcaceae bacterium OttesenSCG-928-D13]